MEGMNTFIFTYYLSFIFLSLQHATVPTVTILQDNVLVHPVLSARIAIGANQELSDTTLSSDVNHAIVMPSVPAKMSLSVTSGQDNVPAWRDLHPGNVHSVPQASTTIRCVINAIVFLPV